MPGFSPAFERLGAAHAAVAVQRQEVLAELLPTADWSADLAIGVYRQGNLTLRISLLGSYAQESRTWLWGWANPQFGPSHRAVAFTQEIGALLQVPELTSPELDLGGYEATGLSAGDAIAMATSGLLGAAAIIPARYDAGVAYFAVDDPAVPAPVWDPAAASRVIMGGIAIFPADHRLTVMRYFAFHHLAYRQTRSATVVAALPGGGEAVAEFDDDDRLAGLAVRVPPVRTA